MPRSQRAKQCALALPSPRERSEWRGGVGGGGNFAYLNQQEPPPRRAFARYASFGGRPSPSLARARVGRVSSITSSFTLTKGRHRKPSLHRALAGELVLVVLD